MPHPLPLHILRRLGDVALYVPYVNSGRAVWQPGDPATESVDGDGTYLNDDTGQIETALANRLRTERTGALLEGAATNAVSAGDSEDFSSGWSMGGGSTVSAATGITAPDGSVAGNWLLAGDGAGSFDSARSSTVVAAVIGTRATFSCWIRKSGSSTCSLLLFNSATNAVTCDVDFVFDANGVPSVQTANTGSGGVLEEWNGWYRVYATGTVPDAGSPTAALYPELHGAPGSAGTYFWGVQVEESIAFPSSYIPVGAAATVLRSADDLRYDALAVNSAGAISGFFVPEMDSGQIPTLATLAYLGDATDYVRVIADSTNKKIRAEVSSGGVSQADINGGTWPGRGVGQHFALTWMKNDVRFYVDGVLVGSDTSAAMPTGSSLAVQVGADSAQANHAFANLQNLVVYRHPLNDGKVAYLNSLMDAYRR